jgi:hypothetical protein
MQKAFEKPVNEAIEFAMEHPFSPCLTALRILVILMPWVLDVLGHGIWTSRGEFMASLSSIDIYPTCLGYLLLGGRRATLQMRQIIHCCLSSSDWACSVVGQL